MLCTNLGEIYGIFNSVANLNSAFREKELYTIKRVYELSQD